jgi:hypothetical protein
MCNLCISESPLQWPNLLYMADLLYMAGSAPQWSDLLYMTGSALRGRNLLYNGRISSTSPNLLCIL